VSNPHEFAQGVTTSTLEFILAIAVLLLVFALLKEITR
jgi:hypothetical protein